MRRGLAIGLTRALRPERQRLFRELDGLQWWDRQRLDDHTRDGVTSLLRHACARVPFYRDFCLEAGLDPAIVDHTHLAAMPRIGKREMMVDRERFLDQEAPRAHFAPSATGGSSGTWFEFFVDARARDLRAAADLRGRTWTGWRPGDRQASLWGHPADLRRVGAGRDRLLGRFVHRTLTLDAYAMDRADLRHHHRELVRFRPVLLLGYASALSLLAEFAEREGLAPPRVGGLISGAETLTPDHRSHIEGHFGRPVLNRYGSRELGIVAQQCGHAGGLHVFGDRNHVEVLRPDGSPCDHGEIGELTVTYLDNRVMPFIRYRTGDLARTSGDTCPCGRAFPLLDTVEGRASEVIVGRNGRYFSFGSPQVFGAATPGVGRMQLVQDRIEEITVKIVPTPAWDQASHDGLTAHLRSLLGDVTVRIELVKDIPPAPSGKYRFTVSSVSPFVGDGE